MLFWRSMGNAAVEWHASGAVRMAAAPAMEGGNGGGGPLEASVLSVDPTSPGVALIGCCKCVGLLHSLVQSWGRRIWHAASSACP